MSSILRVDEIQSVAGTTVIGTSGSTVYSDAAVSFPQYTDSTIPESIETGEIFYNLTSHLLMYWNGTEAIAISYYDANIVTDALIMHLDAGNPQSVNGTGDFLWKDLSANKLHATVVGTNYWTSSQGGFWNYPGGDQTANYIIMPKEAARATDGYWTLETWLRPNSVSATRYFHSMATTGNDNAHINQQTDTTIGIWNGTGSFSITNGTWYQFVERRQGSSNGDIFLNGGNKTASSNITDISVAEGWILNQEQDSILGGFDAAQAPNIDFAICRLYNRALSDAEINQNFQAQRSRFGI